MPYSYDPEKHSLVDLHAIAYRAVLDAGSPRVHEDVALAVAEAIFREGSISLSTVTTIVHERDPFIIGLKAKTEKKKTKADW